MSVTKRSLSRVSTQSALVLSLGNSPLERCLLGLTLLLGGCGESESTGDSVDATTSSSASNTSAATGTSSDTVPSGSNTSSASAGDTAGSAAMTSSGSGSGEGGQAGAATTTGSNSAQPSGSDDASASDGAGGGASSTPPRQTTEANGAGGSGGNGGDLGAGGAMGTEGGGGAGGADSAAGENSAAGGAGGVSAGGAGSADDGAGGTAGEPEDATLFAAGFHELFLHDECTADYPPQPDTCLHEQLHEVGFSFGGEPGTIYDVTLRVRGLFEPTTVSGGETPYPEHPYFKVGGVITAVDYSQWHIEVAEPAQTYWLNHYPQTSHTIYQEDFEVTIPVAGGADVVVRVVDGNDRQIDNAEEGLADRRQQIEGVTSEVLDGQVLRLDVVDVVAQ